MISNVSVSLLAYAYQTIDSLLTFLFTFSFLLLHIRVEEECLCLLSFSLCTLRHTRFPFSVHVSVEEECWSEFVTRHMSLGT